MRLWGRTLWAKGITTERAEKYKQPGVWMPQMLSNPGLDVQFEHVQSESAGDRKMKILLP